MNLGSMLEKERHLWHRISNFRLDAEENGWNRSFARRAAEEYRRFLFLAQVAGHPVSPSDEVDQVWHVERGWIAEQEVVTRLRWIAALPFLVLIGIGVTKIIVGLERDKPVFFLFMLTMATAFVMLVRVGFVRRRTPHGEAVWQNLRASRKVMKSMLARSSTDDLTGAMPMAVALLGSSAFATPGYEPLKRSLGPRGDGSSSGCGSGCSGGGSSCGSGCGGGGCGGCGGGD